MISNLSSDHLNVGVVSSYSSDWDRIKKDLTLQGNEFTLYFDPIGIPSKDYQWKKISLHAVWRMVWGFRAGDYLWDCSSGLVLLNVFVLWLLQDLCLLYFFSRIVKILTHLWFFIGWFKKSLVSALNIWKTVHIDLTHLSYTSEFLKTFKQASGVGDGQGGLACCSPWGCKELDATEDIWRAFQVALVVKNLPVNTGDNAGRHKRHRFNPWLEKISCGNPLQYSCLENPMDRGVWQDTVPRVTKSWTWLRQPSKTFEKGFSSELS